MDTIRRYIERLMESVLDDDDGRWFGTVGILPKATRCGNRTGDVRSGDEEPHGCKGILLKGIKVVFHNCNMYMDTQECLDDHIVYCKACALKRLTMPCAQCKRPLVVASLPGLASKTPNIRSVVTSHEVAAWYRAWQCQCH